MIIEDALREMRKGAKIRIRFMPENEYYTVCKISLNPDFMSDKIDFDSLPLSIVWMKGDRQHPDMMPRYNPPGVKTFQCKHGMFPMMNLLWLMSDEWEIF